MIVYNPAEIAKITGKAYLTILNHINDGKLKAFKLDRHWFVKEGNLLNYIEHYHSHLMPNLDLKEYGSELNI